MPYKPPRNATKVDPDSLEMTHSLPKFSAEPLALTVPPKRVRGKQRVLSSAEIDAFCRCLDRPSTFGTSCGIIGVSEKTMRGWLERGSDIENIEHEADEWLLELASKYAQVMAGGKRKALLEIVETHSLDDPKAAMFLATALIPDLAPTQKVKVDATMTAAPVAKAIPFELCTDEELEIVQAYDKIVNRLRALGQ